MRTALHIIQIWFRVSRPVLYPLIPLMFVLGYQAGGGVVSAAPLTWWLFVLALTWPVGIILYGINDISDYETDKLRQTRNSADGTVLHPSSHKFVWIGIAIAFLLLILSSYNSFGTVGITFSCLVLVASMLYSLPPFRVKCIPGADVVFSGFLYAFGMYWFGYITAAGVVWPPPVESVIISLLAVCLHALGTLRDYTADKKAGNKTLAVLISPRTTSLFIFSTVVIASTWWYQLRGMDVVEFVLFASIAMPALLTIKNPNEKYIQKSLYRIVFIGAVVGCYKVLV